MRRAKAIRWIRGLLGVERHGQVGDAWPYRLVMEPTADGAHEVKWPISWRAELVGEDGGPAGDALAHGVSREEAEAACEAHHARTVAS